MKINDLHAPSGKVVYQTEEKEEIVKIHYKEIVRLKLQKEEAIKECESIKEERIIALQVIKEYGGVELLKQICTAIAKRHTRQRWGYIAELDDDNIFEEPQMPGYELVDYKFPCPALNRKTDSLYWEY